MAANKVKIVHFQHGEQLVSPEFAKLALQKNHRSGGGAFCRPSEVSLYFEVVEDEAKQEGKKSGLSKKQIPVKAKAGSEQKPTQRKKRRTPKKAVSKDLPQINIPPSDYIDQNESKE